MHTFRFVASEGSVFSVSPTSMVITDTGVAQQLAVATLSTGQGHENGKEANLAFFMQISEANIAFLPRLLVTLWHPQNIYLLHFDTKIPPEKCLWFNTTINSTAKFSNVYLLPPEQITYKGVTMLLNTLNAIEFLLSIPLHWDYFINLSGSDYPLVNVVRMRRMLGQPQILDRNITFLQVAESKQFWAEMKQSRFNYVYYDTAVGMKHMKHELLHTWVPHPITNDVGIQFVQAEAWIVAHRSFAHYAVRSAFARKLLILLSEMQDPEEHYFAMLAWNSPNFNHTLAHHAFRGIFWEFNGTMSGQHPYYIDDNRDGMFPFWDAHISKSKCFFARKFRNPNTVLLDRIDQLMSGTHSNADINAVSKSLSYVQNFVSCIADIHPLDDKIRGSPSCY